MLRWINRSTTADILTEAVSVAEEETGSLLPIAARTRTIFFDVLSVSFPLAGQVTSTSKCYLKATCRLHFDLRVRRG